MTSHTQPHNLIDFIPGFNLLQSDLTNPALALAHWVNHVGFTSHSLSSANPYTVVAHKTTFSDRSASRRRYIHRSNYSRHTTHTAKLRQSLRFCLRRIQRSSRDSSTTQKFRYISSAAGRGCRGRRPLSKHTHERTRNTNFVKRDITIYSVHYSSPFADWQFLLSPPVIPPQTQAFQKSPCPVLAFAARGRRDERWRCTRRGLTPPSSRRRLVDPQARSCRLALAARTSSPASCGVLGPPLSPFSTPHPWSRPVPPAELRKNGKGTSVKRINFEINKTNSNPSRSGYGTAVRPRRRRR